MADVEYKGKGPSEPKVNVSGIPKSQYDSTLGTSAPGGGGGIEGNLKAHWPLYTVILGVATIGVILWVNWHNSSSVNTGNTGGATTGAYPDQVYGSQLDADYQQMMQLQNQTNALLQSLMNGKNNGPSTGGGTVVTGVANQGPTLLSGFPNPVYNMPAGGRPIAITTGNSTLATLARYAHWTPQQVFNYGNNANVFMSEGIGIGDINKKIKKGTVVAI